MFHQEEEKEKRKQGPKASLKTAGGSERQILDLDITKRD